MAQRDGTPGGQRRISYYIPSGCGQTAFQKSIEVIFTARWFTNGGQFSAALEASIAELHQVKHCLLVSNGTLGLQLVIRALGLKGRVITSPFTFVATAQSLVWEGIEPVFCDVEEESLTLDPKKVEQELRRGNIQGILAVHIYGNPSRREALAKLAKKYQVPLFYDAAHCFGVKWKSGTLGSFGSADILSFHATKIFHTFEGGAVLTNDSRLATQIHRLRNFGFTGMDQIEGLGINAKMSEVHAAYGLALLPSLSPTVKRLKEIHHSYETRLKGTPGIRLLKSDPGSNFQYFPILVDEKRFGMSRDRLWKKIWNQGCETRRYFYPLLPQLKHLGNLSRQDCQRYFPFAHRAASQVLCLPCYPDLGELEIAWISTLIRRENRKTQSPRSRHPKARISSFVPKGE